MSVRAIGLLSGGLDSTLAAKLMMAQGIEVHAVHFNTGFCLTDNPDRLRNNPGDLVRHDALRAGERLGIPVEMIDIYDEYWDVLTKPKHGYGSAMNPCIDCRAKMISVARPLMKDRGAQFLFTGEVLGQRPMSQHKEAMKTIEREAGVAGLLLRPLSARLLAPTIPEVRGWVDRKRLVSYVGRTRKPQMEMARATGLEEYPSPSGGCCSLADKGFATRLQDLFAHRPGGREERLERTEIYLLKTGRHFRISDDAKLVVARDDGENRFLHFHRRAGWRLEAIDVPGPVAILTGRPSEEDVRLAASIVASYGPGRANDLVRIGVERGPQTSELSIAPMDRAETNRLGVHRNKSRRDQTGAGIQ